MHDIQKRLLLAITTAYSRSTGGVLVDLHALVKIGPSTGHLCEARPWAPAASAVVCVASWWGSAPLVTPPQTKSG